MITTMDKMFLIQEDGTRKALSEDEVRELIATGNTELLQNVIALDADGIERRPYRFIDMDPPTFNEDDNAVTI